MAEIFRVVTACLGQSLNCGGRTGSPGKTHLGFALSHAPGNLLAFAPFVHDVLALSATTKQQVPQFRLFRLLSWMPAVRFDPVLQSLAKIQMG